VYQILVKRHLRKQFDHLSGGDFESVLRGVDDHVHHRFAGEHPLGGDRHTKHALRLWFQRLFRTGWPWDLRAAAEWSATVTPARGEIYLNRGVHLIRIRRGRVTQLYAYEDSQAVAKACRPMADLGITEAAAAAIES
jgi:ketosteroid isomerase-like protein